MQKHLNVMTLTTGMRVCICIFVIMLKGGLTAPPGLHFFRGGELCGRGSVCIFSPPVLNEMILGTELVGGLFREPFHRGPFQCMHHLSGGNFNDRLCGEG